MNEGLKGWRVLSCYIVITWSPMTPLSLRSQSREVTVVRPLWHLSAMDPIAAPVPMEVGAAEPGISSS